MGNELDSNSVFNNSVISIGEIYNFIMVQR